MAAYRRVYDSRHLQADCHEPGSAPEPYARQSSMGYLYPVFTFHPMCTDRAAVAMAAAALFTTLIRNPVPTSVVAGDRSVPACAAAAAAVDYQRQ